MKQIISFSDLAATQAFADKFAPRLVAGDCILLDGEVGAGKTHLARAIILNRLDALSRSEDVPSPTFTLVQAYNLDELEIWHADLYRLSGPDEVEELGLSDALENAITLIEWPERLGNEAPEDALRLTIEIDGEFSRKVTLEYSHAKWSSRLAEYLDE